MKTVTIEYCYGDRQELVSTHKTNCDTAAIDRAIAKHFGKRASFYQDNGICTAAVLYGRVGHYSTTMGCASMDTGRVSVRVE